MKIFGICLIKNEEDIIAYSLKHHTSWADKVFVYDNGSTDRTWEIVIEEAKKNPKIVPFKSENKPFSDGLRAEVYNKFKHYAKEGDWWYRADPDEFYIDQPRAFLCNVPKYFQCVYSLHYEYELSKKCIETINFEEDISQILSNIKYYNPKCYSEIRFFRHRNRLRWSGKVGQPEHVGVAIDKKIRIKHFQYRSPKQIITRINTRKQARKSGNPFFKKDDVDDWIDIIKEPSKLLCESETMPYREINDPYKEELKLRKVLRFTLHLFKIFP